MRNAKRDPLSNDHRHALIDAIDQVGGIEAFAQATNLGRESIARALTGAGVLAATRSILIAQAESFVFGLARVARGTAGGVKP